MSTAGGEGGSHCPGMFIFPPPAFIQGRIMQHHGSEATFAPTWRVCGGNIHTYIYTCTNRHYLPNKKPGWLLPQGMASRWKWSRCGRVLYFSLTRWAGLSGKAGASDAPSVCNAVIILSTAHFIGQCVGCRNMFNQLSCRGGLDLMSVVPSLACVCVCMRVCVCAWMAPSLCCGVWPAVEPLVHTLLSAVAGLSD